MQRELWAKASAPGILNLVNTQFSQHLHYLVSFPNSQIGKVFLTELMPGKSWHDPG